MSYLLALFTPLLYFILQKKWPQAILTGILFIASCICFITIVGAFVGFILWFIASILAMWDVRKGLMREQATMIAEEIAKTRRQQSEP